MSDWYREKNYCTSCRRSEEVIHRDCGGKKWVNITTGMTYCDKCERSWRAETSIYHCDCGNVQKMIYSDTVLVIEVGDQVIAEVGDMVYVRRRSGAVVVGRRDIHTVTYDRSQRWA
jgi:hypothetical protein